MVKHIINWIRSRIYLLVEDKFYPLAQPDSPRDEVPKFSLIIIGREHYLEDWLSYPITDSKDLRQVLTQQSSSYDLLDTPCINEDGAKVRCLSLHSNTRQKLLTQKWTFWLPESWLLTTQLQGFSIFHRAMRSVYVAATAQRTFSAPAAGRLTHPHVFLMSVGLDTSLPAVEVQNDAYEQTLYTGLTNLKPSQWWQVAKGQYVFANLQQLLHWPAVFSGLLLGYFAFSFADLGLAKWRLNQLNTAIEAQNVAKLVQQQNQNDAMQAQLSALQQLRSGPAVSFLVWQVISKLIDRDTTLLLINIDGDTSELRFEAESATEVLQRIQDLPVVESAEFSTAVRDSLGKERFTVAIQWKQGAANG